jgi:hypothetical protein
VGRVGGDRVAIEKQSKKGTPVASPSRPAATPAVPASSLPFFIGVPPSRYESRVFYISRASGNFSILQPLYLFPGASAISEWGDVFLGTQVFVLWGGVKRWNLCKVTTTGPSVCIAPICHFLIRFLMIFA